METGRKNKLTNLSIVPMMVKIIQNKRGFCIFRKKYWWTVDIPSNDISVYKCKWIFMAQII